MFKNINFTDIISKRKNLVVENLPQHILKEYPNILECLEQWNMAHQQYLKLCFPKESHLFF